MMCQQGRCPQEGRGSAATREVWALCGVWNRGTAGWDLGAKPSWAKDQSLAMQSTGVAPWGSGAPARQAPVASRHERTWSPLSCPRPPFILNLAHEEAASRGANRADTMPRPRRPAGGFTVTGAFTRPWVSPLLLLVLLMLLSVGTAQVGATRLLRSEAGVGPGSLDRGLLQLSRLGRADNPGTSAGLPGSGSQGSGSSGGGGGGSTLKPHRALQQSPTPSPYLTGSDLVKQAAAAFDIPLADGQTNSTDASTPPPAGEEPPTHAGSCRCDSILAATAI